jgi:cytoskeleton protein RodZ
MTDDTDKPDTESPEAGTDGPIGGERLAEARRAKQISVLEIAKELHVEEAKIRALENNEFEVLGAPVFAKGHLKKYSQLVGVNHDDVLADYYRLTRTQEMPPVVVSRKKPRKEISPGPWLAAVLVLLLLALAYWLIVEKPFSDMSLPVATTPPASVATTPPASAETAVEEAPTDEQPAEEVPVAEEVADDSPAGEVPSQLPAVVPEEPTVSPERDSLPAAEQAPPPVSGDDDVRLSVTFLGDCWTEITDASGRRLFFQLGRSGRTVNVSGPGPLSVLFGDADNVDVRVNGEDFIMPATGRRGQTARLTISGP